MNKRKSLIHNLKVAQSAHSCENLEEATARIFIASKNAVGCQSGFIKLLNENLIMDDTVILLSERLIEGLDPKISLVNESKYENNIDSSNLIKYWPRDKELPYNILISPIILNNSTTGLLCLANKEVGFDEEDLDIASVFSHVASIALSKLSATIQIAEGELKYRSLYNNLPLGIYVTNSMDQIIDMNERMLEILNINSLKDFEGKDLLSYYIDPQDRIEWQNSLEKENKIQYLETRFRGPDGSILWVSENAHVIKGPDGQDFCEVTIEDITTRKRSEEAFLKTYLKLDSAYKELNERAKWMESLNKFLFDIAGEITGENIFRTVLENLKNTFSIKFAGFGKINEDLSFMTMEEDKIITPELEKEIKAEYPLTIKDLSILNSESHRLIVVEEYLSLADMPETEFVKLLNRLSVNRENSIILISVGYDNNIHYSIIIVLEKCILSDNQKYFLENMAEYLSMAIENQNLYDKLSYSYAQLESAQEAMKKQERIKAMGQIASGIAHDINNTLAPITLYTEALIETELNLSERADRYLRTIQNAVADIENVTQRLRTFYKQGEEKETEFILITDLFDEIIELTRPKWESIPNKEGIVIQIEKVMSNYKSYISGSKSDVRESMVNCIFNAVDAMPSGGLIKLVESTQGDNTVISITDEGIGMSEEQLNHCLEPFYTTKGASGTGLGLAEVYGMMQRHGGDVEIKSNPDSGTQIHLIFPPASIIEKDEITISENRKLSSMNILCVDDDLRILEGLKEMLTLDKHIVETVQSGIDAIELLKSRKNQKMPFDVMITDLGMPGMDGYELASKVKELYPEMPIVLLSGWGSQINKSDYKSEDICCVLSKPPRIKTIRKTLSEINNGEYSR